jgi:hypothetical protein
MIQVSADRVTFFTSPLGCRNIIPKISGNARMDGGHEMCLTSKGLIVIMQKVTS